MTQRHYVTSRRSAVGPTFMALGIIVLAVCGGVLLLHATGTIRVPFLTADVPPPKPTLDLRGKVLLPVSARPIRAYSMVSAADFSRPGTLTVTKIPYPEELLPPNAVREAAQLPGRVLRRDKPAGQIFLESEFYPVGTRPGPAAGVPPGKRALRLRADAVPGLHGLLQGDRFDIVMTVEVQVEQPKHKPRAPAIRAEGPYASLLEAEAEARQVEPPRVKRRRAEVRVIVKNGLLVQPIHNREAVGTLTNPMRPTQRPKKPIEELIIAVDPAEVAALNQALAIEAHLQVAIRSGQVTNEKTGSDEEEIPDIAIEFEPPGPEIEGMSGSGKVKLVEVIGGSKKRIEAVPVDKADDDQGEEQEE